MSYPLSEIHASILQGRILGAPEPDKKGLFSIFSRDKTPTLSELAKPFHSLFTNGGWSYFTADYVSKFLTGYFNKPDEFFQLSPAQIKEALEHNGIGKIENDFMPAICKTLFEHGWIAGEKWLAFRFVLVLAGYKTSYNEERWLSFAQLFQGVQQKEAFLLLLMGMLKKRSCQTALNFAIKGAKKYMDFNEEDTDWLFRYFEENATHKFGNALPKLAKLYLNLVTSYEQFHKTNPLDTLQKTGNIFQFEERLVDLSDTELRAFGTILRFMNFDFYIPTSIGDIFDGFPRLTPRLLGYVTEKAPITDTEVADQIRQKLYSSTRKELSGKVVQYLNEYGASKAFERPLFEAFWDLFFFSEYEYNITKMEPALRKQTALQLAASGEALTWESLLWTGFQQVPIPSNHSPYFGLHPDQIRPIFQLMRAVANVDIVKIYKVGKLYHVRFIFGGEMYDMPTGDGFGVGPLPHFNTLLFEGGVPYQLVVLEVPLFDSQLNKNHKTKVVTLVNKETYDRFAAKILPQGFVDFAPATAPALPFTKSIDELGNFKFRPDLDVVKLDDDPKFMGIREQMEKLEPLEAWMELLRHCLSYPLDGKPLAAWQAEAKKLVSAMSTDQFRKGLVMVVDGMIKGDEWFSDDEKICGLRGLTWLCRLNTDDSLRYLLQRTANKAYKKVPGGPLNAKLGNLAMEGLVADGSLQAFGALGNLQAKAKYPVFVRAIASAMKKFDKLLKQYPAEELQDRVIPSHELVDGSRAIPIGNYEARLKVEGLKVKLDWLGANGKTIASVPAELKRDFEVDLQTVKGEVKSMEETIQAQLARLESSWIQDRSWPLDFWQEHYRSHELMWLLVQKLIWQIESDGKRFSFMPATGGSFDQNWQPIELPASGQIRLWHPALASSVAEVEAWRNLLFEQKIVQPFKQAFREVYLLTPAEEASVDQSMRFAGHYLKGNTLYSLGKNRMWTMSYDQAPLRKIPALNLLAELSITGGVLYSNCTTGALCFRELGAGTNVYNTHRQAKLPLKDVPLTVLSEVMRDVDLFVAVSNIGIDPYFDQKNTGDLLQYWRDVSFGAKSKTEIADIRHDLLKRLLPMTKIAPQCRLDGNNLHVTGKLREYKINLNSGNILMLPNDQYLCIVPAHDAKLEKRIWLPFEGGDHILMLVLSKAFLLADDDKITDQQILGQLRR